MSRTVFDTAGGQVRIPADVDRPDTLIGGLTVRQLAVLAVGAVVIWAGYALTRQLIPLVVFAAVAIPTAGAVITIALARRDGLPADQFAWAALAYRRGPPRMVLAPDGVQAAPSWAGPAGPLPAPLRLPVGVVGDDGVIDLGADGRVLICRASAITFTLRTHAEQRALVGAFARWLNSLDAPVQVLIRATPLDLSTHIARLRTAAAGLPNPGLEACAHDHADYLEQLAASRDLLSQQVLLVLRQPPVPYVDSAERLRRRAEDAGLALAAAGITLTHLDGPAAAACLSGCLDPGNPVPDSAAEFAAGMAWADDVIIGPDLW